MVDLNADLGEIFNSLFKKKGATSSSAGSKSGAGGALAPYKTIIIVGSVFFVLMIAFVFVFLKPYYQERAKKEKQVEKNIGKQNDINNLTTQQKSLRNKLVKSIEKFENNLELFENSANVKELYRSISQIAKNNDLLVLNIKEVEQKKKTEEPKRKRNRRNKDNEKDKNALPDHVQQVDVTVDLSGSFRSYMSFKQDLANARPLLSIRKEKITMDNRNQAASGLIISLNLSAYAIDKTSFKEAIGDFKGNTKPASEVTDEK